MRGISFARVALLPFAVTTVVAIDPAPPIPMASVPAPIGFDSDLVSRHVCGGARWDTARFPASVGEEVSPLVDRLYGSEPNLFNPRTRIRFSLARQGRVSLKIYDSSGRIVRNLVDEAREAGGHAVVWDGTSDSDRRVVSGVYWIQMESGRFTSNRKLILVK